MAITIGQLSRETGVKIPTIRYYEQIGLLHEPDRTQGGQRRYDRTVVEQLRFIQHARELGFAIGDVRELLEISGEPASPCEEIDRIAARHLVAVKQRITRLRTLQAELENMLESCQGGQVAHCKVLESLATTTR